MMGTALRPGVMEESQHAMYADIRDLGTNTGLSQSGIFPRPGHSWDESSAFSIGIHDLD